MSSVFTKIINGELPCFKIHETEKTFSFLALDQIQLGHTLIIPKLEVDHFMDVPGQDFTEVFQRAQPLGRAIKKVTGCQRVGLAVQGFEVPHFHLHLIPMWDPSDFSFKKATRRSEAEMKEVQEKIVQELKKEL